MSSGGATHFVETLEHRRFEEFCEACQRDRYIGLCYGPPGVGKTVSALRYARWENVLAYRESSQSRKLLAKAQSCEVVFYTPAVVNTPKIIERDILRLRYDLAELRREHIRANAAPEVARLERQIKRHCERRAIPVLGRRFYADVSEKDLSKEERVASFRAEQALRRLHERLGEDLVEVSDPTTLIVIDEADRLKESGLEQLRDMFDRDSTGLVLIGMPGIEKRLARYPQLYSRVGFVHEFRPLTAKEVRRLLEEKRLTRTPMGAALKDEEVISAILRVTGGNFRLLNRLLTQITRILEINRLKQVTREVVDAARESLVIGTV